ERPGPGSAPTGGGCSGPEYQPLDRVPVDAVGRVAVGEDRQVATGAGRRGDGVRRRVERLGLSATAMATRRKGKRGETPDGGRGCATWWVPGEKQPRKVTAKTQQEAIARRAKRREQAGLDLGGLRTVGA